MPLLQIRRAKFGKNRERQQGMSNAKLYSFAERGAQALANRGVLVCASGIYRLDPGPWTRDPALFAHSFLQRRKNAAGVDDFERTAGKRLKCGLLACLWIAYLAFVEIDLDIVSF